MNQQTYKGRSIDFDAIKKSKVKVTLGFKCYPQLKLELAIEANRLSMSLSEYMEILVDGKRNQELELEKLREQINFYENDKLLKLFQKYKGQRLKVIDAFGNEKETIISTCQDIFTYILLSIKI